MMMNEYQATATTVLFVLTIAGTSLSADSGYDGIVPVTHAPLPSIEYLKDATLSAILSDDQKIKILVGFAEGLLAETEPLDQEIAALVSENIWDLI